MEALLSNLSGPGTLIIAFFTLGGIAAARQRGAAATLPRAAPGSDSAARLARRALPWHLPVESTFRSEVKRKTAQNARAPALDPGDERKNRPKCTRPCPRPGGQAQKPPEMHASPSSTRGTSAKTARNARVPTIQTGRKGTFGANLSTKSSSGRRPGGKVRAKEGRTGNSGENLSTKMAIESSLSGKV